MGITATGEDEVVDEGLVWSPAACCYVGLHKSMCTCTPLGPRSINKDEGSRRKNLGAEIWCIFGGKQIWRVHIQICSSNTQRFVSVLPWQLFVLGFVLWSWFILLYFHLCHSCVPPHHHQTLVVLRHLKNGPKHLSVFVSMKQTISFKPNGLTSSTLAAPILQSDWSYLYLHSPKMNSKQKISLRCPHLVCLRL